MDHVYDFGDKGARAWLGETGLHEDKRDGRLRGGRRGEMRPVPR